MPRTPRGLATALQDRLERWLALQAVLFGSVLGRLVMSIVGAGAVA